MMFRISHRKSYWMTVVMLIWLVGWSVGLAEAEDQPGIVFDRALFDRMDQAFNEGNGNKTGTGGELAWGESYVMLSYLEMYRATKDRHYLDKLVDHADHVLMQRDDNRGFKDYSGRSRPAWSVGGKYTVAELVLKADSGADVLKFRSTKFAYNDQTMIRIKPLPEAGRFDLFIENAHWTAQEKYAGLSMDRDSPDFVEKLVNMRESVSIERNLACSDEGSGLVTVEAIGQPTQPPTRDNKGQPLADRAVAMIALELAYHGYSGQVTYPMLEFAWIVRQEAGLQKTYGKKAAHYIAEAARVLADADEEWRDGPQPGEGYYVSGQPGCPFWTDNIGKAFNYQCSLGRSLLRLAQLTGDPKWDRQMRAIARLFKRHLKVADNGSYIWHYGWGIFEKGWTRDNSPSLSTPTWEGRIMIEDISHGHMDVDFARMCVEAEVIFDRTDMIRLANTWLKNVVVKDKWTTNNWVDGQGGQGSHNAVIGGWCDLAVWEPAVAESIRKISVRQGIGQKDTGAAMWTVSRLLKWGKLLAWTGFTSGTSVKEQQ